MSKNRIMKNKIKKIKKRDGSIVSFNSKKIANAILKAMKVLGIGNKRIARELTIEVIYLINKKIHSFENKTPTVEQIQETVEQVLERYNKRLFKVYSLYRRSRNLAREVKEFFKIKDDLKFSANSLKVLEERYLLKDETGKIIETPTQMFKRVAKAIAGIDKKYKQDEKKSEKDFFEIMKDLEFLPNSPTLMNAGTKLGQLSACFVLPIKDSLDSIFTTLKNMAKIQQSGGGTGFSFSKLRPEGDMVKSTKGIASGPVSFIKIYDVATDVIKQGGKRRGANMAILHCTHPDIEKFIHAKQKGKQLSNFNISVAATDNFMNAAIKNKQFSLINPRTKKQVKKVDAKEVFDNICKAAWKTGDPGIIFIDEINRKQPTPEIGKIEATNPCITSNSWIMTSKGPRQVKELIGKRTEVVVNGEKWSNLGNGFFYTGIKPVFNLKTREGFEISLTENHLIKAVTKLTRYVIKSEWKKVKELKPGDKIILSNQQGLKWKGKFSEKEGYLIGSLIGDGTVTKNKVLLNSWGESSGEKSARALIEKYAKSFPHRSDFKGWRYCQKTKKYCLALGYLKRLLKELKMDNKKKITPEIEKTSSDFYKGFLKGFFDADGSVQGSQEKGVSIRLSQSDIQRLKAVQRMLLRLGIFSKIYQNRRKAGKSWLPDGKGNYKFYRTKAQHELVISGESILKFFERIGFENSDKQDKLETLIKKYKRKLNQERDIATIKKIKPLRPRKVYDIQIPGINAFDANGFYVHNCGEVPLLAYESCNLGSINLSKFIKNKKIDFEKLKKVVHTAVHFLDNVIDKNKYPLPEIEEITKANRKIGLGIMGFADMLIKLRIPYNSKQALDIAKKIMSFISKEARNASINLAKRRGSFPNFNKSIWKKRKNKFSCLRNATCTTIAPTGTISIIANCSSGIEPLFAIAYVREIMKGKRFVEINKNFQIEAIKRGLYNEKLIKKIALAGSIQKTSLPKEMKRIYITALDIKPDWHIKIQAAFQNYVDNAVSKTINMPKNSTIEEIKRIYLMAWRLKCKGITVYRYGSKPKQVLYIGKKGKLTKAELSYSGGSACSECSI